LLLLMGCGGAAESVLSPRVASLEGFERDSVIAEVPGDVRPRERVVSCALTPDTTTIWVAGVPYLEIVERCF
jgi:hypothetical protein